MGVGTLIVKPDRHVVRVADLDESEAIELGPLLHKTSSIVAQLACPEQVYVCLWSHGPAHIHFVVQPVDHELMERMGGHGPRLQVAMFDSEPAPDEAAVSAFAAAARDNFRGM